MLTSPLLDVRTSKPTSLTSPPRTRFSARNSTVFPAAGRTSIGPLKFLTVNWPPAGIVPRQVYTVSSRPTIWASATAETALVSDSASRRVGRVDRIAITWSKGGTDCHGCDIRDGPRVGTVSALPTDPGSEPGSVPDGLSCAVPAGQGTRRQRGKRPPHIRPAGRAWRPPRAAPSPASRSARVRDQEVDLIARLHRDHLGQVRALSTGHHRLGKEPHLDDAVHDAGRDLELRQPLRLRAAEAHPLRPLVGVDGHLVQVLIVDDHRRCTVRGLSIAVQVDRLSSGCGNRRLLRPTAPARARAHQGQRADGEYPYCPHATARDAASCYLEPTAGPPHGAL